MVMRRFRQDGRTALDGLPAYCEHDLCVLAWNLGILSLLIKKSPGAVWFHLRQREEDVYFPLRCCCESEYEVLFPYPVGLN